MEWANNVKGYIERAAASGMFDSTTTYETSSVTCDDFPKTEKPVWVLGKAYSALYDLGDLKQDISANIWFTYRKNFWPIGGVGPTADTGWGCMLRCGQMVLAQALVRRHLGNDWKWTPGCTNPIYAYIMSLFQDKKDCCYSIHHIAQMGVSEGKEVGQWFGPNTVAQVLKKLATNDHWSSIAVHIALDNTIVTEDIVQLCRRKPSVGSSECSACKEGLPGDVTQHRCPPSSRVTSPDWRPLVLFVPLRLGLTEVNPLYSRALKACFEVNQSLGIIGGKPNHAYYFIGVVEDQLIYLDPHTTQPCSEVEPTDTDQWSKTIEGPDTSYHCPLGAASRMDIAQLDPSIALAFYCHTAADFSDLCQNLHKKVLSPDKQPMFEICRERPRHWQPPDDLSLQGEPPGSSGDGTSRHYDTDDEFELL